MPNGWKMEEYRQKLEERSRVNREAFKGKYQQELNGLLGLSKVEIDNITPGTTDLETYAQLISIVKEASADNIDQAELKKRIMALGEVGMEIANMVPSLADLLV